VHVHRPSAALTGAAENLHIIDEVAFQTFVYCLSRKAKISESICSLLPFQVNV